MTEEAVHELRRLSLGLLAGTGLSGAEGVRPRRYGSVWPARHSAPTASSLSTPGGSARQVVGEDADSVPSDEFEPMALE